jgi:hypothetical protein
MKQQHNNIMEKMSVLDAIFGLSWAWSSMDPVTLIQSWRKLLPDLEDDLQGFPNKEVSKSEIFDMVCAMRSFETSTKIILKNGYKLTHVNWASSTRQTQTCH